MLDGSQSVRRAAAYHERASVDVFLRDDVLLRQRIVFIGDQIDPGIKELVDIDSRNMSGLLDEGEEDIGFIL